MKKTVPPPPVRGVFEQMSAHGIGRLWSVTPQAVGLWHRAGCPRNSDGTYCLAEVIAWREAKIRAEVQADTKQGAVDWLNEQRRQTAIKLERANRYGEGLLLDREFVHSLLAKHASFLRDLGGRLQDAFGPEALAMADVVVLKPLERDMREEIARRVEQQAAALAQAEAEAEEEAPKAKPKRKGGKRGKS